MTSLKSILLVEDDMVDMMSVKRALKDINVTNPLYHVENGVEALEYFRNKENPRPTIILLDLNMPKMGGIEFLSIIKKMRQYEGSLSSSSPHHGQDLTRSGHMIWVCPGI